MRRLAAASTLLLLTLPVVGESPASAAPSAIAASDTRPRTIPALRRWSPAAGSFRLGDRPRVVVPRDDARTLRSTAALTATDLRAVSGMSVPVRVGVRPRAGDVVLALGAAPRLGREGYRMTVGRSVRISAVRPAGAFYGTRSLLQLLRTSPRVPAGTAVDWPRYPERGVMLDLGRVPFTYAHLRRVVRVMSYAKLNLLHLHLSDNNAFRIKSDRFPQITADAQLTKAQVRALVAMARRHHVVVVPEIDMPGHMAGILRNLPQFQLANVFGVKDETRLDITNPAARRFAKQLIAEMLPLFPGRWWHIGADEYIPQLQYALHPSIEAYAKRRYGADAVEKDAVHGFVNELNRFVRRHGKTGRVWNDDAGGGKLVPMDSNLVVEWWTNHNPIGELNPPSPQELLAKGHRVLNAGWWPTYYNTPVYGDINPPSMREAYDGWAVHSFNGNVYLNRDIQLPPDVISPAERRNLGTKVHVWGDGSITDPTALVTGMMPHVRVIAQKAWRSPQYATYDEFVAVGRTVGAAPRD